MGDDGTSVNELVVVIIDEFVPPGLAKDHPNNYRQKKANTGNQPWIIWIRRGRFRDIC